jgi:hypothetical protein
MGAMCCEEASLSGSPVIDPSPECARRAQLLHDAAHRHGATVLIVGHDTRIAPYADLVFHLEDGCLTEQPAPSDTAARSATGARNP